MITSKHVNARGEVALWEATDDGHRQVMLAATDAAHALAADPKRWSLDDPRSEDGGDNPMDVMKTSRLNPTIPRSKGIAW
jgi:hypothetical protein